MSYYKKILNKIKLLLLPLARIVIRHISILKIRKYVWKKFSWIEINFQNKTIYGTKINGNTKDFIQKQIYYFGVWEPNLSNWMIERFKKLDDRIFVDIGANIGYYTVLAAEFIKNGTVISIEASPPIFKKLKKNVSINNCNNVRLVPYAATSIPCCVPIYYGSEYNEGTTSTLAKTNNDKPDVTVNGLPLSKILLDREISKVGIIKIDVEGAEYDVVQGMIPIINKLNDDVAIIVEITPEAQTVNQIEEIFSIFKLAGFHSYVIPANNNGIDNVKGKYDKPNRIYEIPEKQEDIIFSKLSI